MNTINSKNLAASVIALVFSFIVAPAAMAEEAIYPGSNCSFEGQGSGGTLDHQNGHTRTTARAGMVVTCPVPIIVPRNYQWAQAANKVDFTVVVRIKDNNGVPASCHVRKVNHSGQATDSDVKQSSGRTFGSTLIFDKVRFLLPLREWAVLRCQMHRGGTLAGYSVITTDF